MNKRLPVLGLLSIAALAFALSSHYLSESNQKYQEREKHQTESVAASLDYLRHGPDGTIDPNYRSKAFKQIKQRSGRATSLGLNFNFRGPDNVGGRTRSVLELYGQPNVLLIGSVTGGLFISNNGGATWEPHMQFQNLENSSSFISCIAQDITTGTIYVGSGSSFDGLAGGYGMYKSVDQGKTFTHLTSTTPEERSNETSWGAINRIVVGPDGKVYAATSTGLRISSDGGTTWMNPIYLGGTTEAYDFPCSDVIVTTSGRVITAATFGALYISEDGSDRSFVQQVNTGMPAGGINRVCLAYSIQNEDVIYAALTDNVDRSLKGIYKTQDGAKNWKLLLEPFDNFNPYCNSIQCQGRYDAAIAVSPTDPNTIFIGGVQMWRYDGNLTRVANEFGAAPFLDALPFYVHADKHFIYFSPNDNQRMYVTTDGGLSMTEDRGETWQGLNKLYGTSQFYSVAYSADGDAVIGGTQDNGTLALFRDSDISPNLAIEVAGGDGIDAEISQVSRIYFATNPRGEFLRSEDRFPAATIAESDGGYFLTMIRLWESINDASSQDSIVFENTTSEEVIAVANGGVKSFTQNITPSQSSAKVIPNSIRVIAGSQTLTNSGSKDVLSGEGSGSVIFNSDGSFDVSANFSATPGDNQNVVVTYQTRFKANDVLSIKSENLSSNLTSHFFDVRLETDLNPGESIIVQDPVQSMIAASSNEGLGIYRGVLNLQETPSLIQIPEINGNVHCAEFTSDGNTVFIGVNSRLMRVSGLNELYTIEDVDKLTVDALFTSPNSLVTGISIDPQDDNRIVFSLSGFGLSNNVVEITDALIGLGTARVIHGDLPQIPVYDVEIDKNDPDIILLGTEFGIWATSEASSPSVSWSDENNELTYVPVYDVRQQKLPHDKASNSGVYYIGTFGRGIWESSSLVGIGDFADFADNGAGLSGLTVFPNPMNDQGTIEFESSEAASVTLKVMDMNGRLVKSWQHNSGVGTNRSSFSATELRSGFYFLSVETSSFSESSKFIVL